MDWRERRLLPSLKRLASITPDDYARLVPPNGRAGIDAFRQVALRCHDYFAQAEREAGGLSNGTFAKKKDEDDVRADRTVERAFASMHAALDSLGEPLRVERPADGPARIGDAPGAWAADRLVPPRRRLQPEALPRVERLNEKRSLERFFGATGAAVPSVAVVSAPAGFGKSTLLGQLFSGARSLTHLAATT